VSPQPTIVASPVHAAPATSAHARRPWKRYAIVAFALMFVVALGLFYARARSKQANPPKRFEAIAVSRGPLQARVTASGTVSPLITVQVGSQVSGKIQTLGADFNSVVRKGQVIAQIDPAFYRAAVEQARAKVLSTEADRAKAEAELENADRAAGRNRELIRQKLIAQSAADDSETALRVARAQLASARGSEAEARAALHQASINLVYTTIESPIDGVVISRNVDVGQTVAASLQSPTLFVIAQDLRAMQVDSNIAEADVGHLASGMTATFTVDAYPAETFAGSIREVRNNPQTLQNVVTYDAVIDVDNSNLKLKPGMTANVTVVYADRSDVVRLPNAALRFRPPEDIATRGQMPVAHGDQRVVWVMRGSEPRPSIVRIGVTDGLSSEVLDENLKPGDLVVTEVLAAPKGGPGSFGRVF
jgi:HlyD family secretion protein